MNTLQRSPRFSEIHTCKPRKSFQHPSPYRKGSFPGKKKEFVLIARLFGTETKNPATQILVEYKQLDTSDCETRRLLNSSMWKKTLLYYENGNEVYLSLVCNNRILFHVISDNPRIDLELNVRISIADNKILQCSGEVDNNMTGSGSALLKFSDFLRGSKSKLSNRSPFYIEMLTGNTLTLHTRLSDQSFRNVIVLPARQDSPTNSPVTQEENVEYVVL